MNGSGQYDLVVIGAGQGGAPLAGAFARAGKRVALVERDEVGGTCINTGCTPTKTMIASARVAEMARRATEYGVHVGAVEVDLAEVRNRKRSVVESFRGGSERRLSDSGVELLRGSARFTAVRSLEVSSGETRRTLTGDAVVIDTGTRPAVPSIPGIESVDYLNSTSIMELDVVPAHLIVIGGGYVGVEFAQMFRRFGSAVTILQKGDRLLPREDPDVAERVAAILSDDGIEIHLGTDAKRVAQAGSRLDVSLRSRSGKSRSISGSHLLIAAGRVPSTGELNLAAAGVEADPRGYIRVDERLETTAPGTYAVGDVNGGPAFTHVSYDDFRILRTNLLGAGGASTSGRNVPYTVFIDPQLGRIGISEREARDAGHSVLVAQLEMSSVARAIETGETRGFMKAVVDADSGLILGAAILGMEGGEIAAMIQIAMIGGVKYSALRDAMFAHPTLAESLNNLFPPE